jgi:hypothetical protein
MKTTNFELSKKLLEISFREHTGIFWKMNSDGSQASPFRCGHGGDDYSVKYLPSYELETLLEALPEKVNEEEQSWAVQQDYVGYMPRYIRFIKNEYFCDRLPNEPLADCAARLILKLHEQGIINFKS